MEYKSGGEKNLNQAQYRIQHDLPRKERHQRPQTQSQAQFRYPGENFIKLNFNGVSKGNPGLAGFGGIFRDNMG